MHHHRFEREISLEGALTDVSDTEEPSSPQAARKLTKRVSSREIHTDLAKKSMYRGCTDGSLMTASAYMLAYLLTQSQDQSEDLVHLCHSLYMASVAVAATTSLQYGGANHHEGPRSPLRSSNEEKKAWVFAPWAELRAVRMYRWSLGYFFVDMASVIASLFNGRKQSLWADRLAHRLLLSTATVSCLLPGAGSRARCCHLGLGYLAEVSSVPLRLLSLVKQWEITDPQVIRSLRLATSVQFAVFRAGGGLACLYLIWKARHCVEKQMAKVNLFVGGLTCLLNAACLAKLIRGRRRIL